MALPPPIRGFRSKPINALILETRANAPLAGFGVRVRKTPGGTIIDAEPGEEGAAPVPVAWTVREKVVETTEGGDEQNKQTWEVYAPIVALPGREICPEGMAVTGWHELPEGLDTGTLWAVYHPAAGEGSSATEESVTLETSRPDGKLAVRIGSFEADSSEDGAGKTWTQVHAGVIVVAGEGAAAPAYCLGPIEEDPEGSAGTADFVQFLGLWTWDKEGPGGGVWVFEKAVDEQGNERPPALRWTRRTHLYRYPDLENGSSSSSPRYAIYYRDGPDFGAGSLQRWLGLHTAQTFKEMAFTPPENETGNGALTALSQTFTFLGTQPADGANDVILETVVEDANATTTYEDAAGNGGSNA